MFSRNARRTTFLFMAIILVTVFFDLVISDRSFSYNSGAQKTNNTTITADATKASWFWKN